MSGMQATRAFTIRDGLERGYTAAELRSMAFTTPARGVRITAAIGDEATALFEAVRLLAADDQFFSHTTAARIHGVPLPARFEREARVHLASPTGRARMQRPGVVGHRLKSATIEIGDMRVEALPDAFVHLATMLSLEELVAAGDWIVSSKRPGALQIEMLSDAVRRFAGARGIDRARHALALVRTGSESPRESLVRLLIVFRGLPEPTLQHEVFDAFGTFVARLDLSWPPLRLAVEYDGEQHVDDPAQVARDVVRLKALRELGWEIIQIRKDDLRDGGSRVIAEIAAAHLRRTRRLAA